MTTRTLTLSLSLAFAQLIATAALAQGPANTEAYPPGYTPPAAKKATATEKADGKVARKSAGSAAAKEDSHAEGNPLPDPKAKVARADRQKARAERKAESNRANKAGEMTSKGETGITK